MADWTEEYLKLIEDCETRESKLTQWEVNFIASVREQIEEGRRLSLRQSDVLDRIWEKATKEG